MQPRERLFHVLVALGASAATASGCGGDSPGSSQPPDGEGDAAVVRPPDAGRLIIPDASIEPKRDALADASHDAAVPVCEHTQQLTCRTYAPQKTDCVCNPNAPLAEEDCVARGRWSFECAAYEPPTGCDCVYITGPR